MKKTIIAQMAFVLLLGFCLVVTQPSASIASSLRAPSETWAIYWYICGSDLETDSGFATDDLLEMLDISLSENVSVVIQTGGAYEWQNDVVSSDYSQRFVYDKDGLEEVDRLPIQNMGEPDTLTDFLQFCVAKYPADRQAVIIWNHGAGSIGGIACDEQFDMDSLTLGELYEAFSTVANGTSSPLFEVVGFDACLMATIDTAWVLEEFARYLVASQETEPGFGWSYDGILSALVDDPSMDGESLGKIICDTYAESCREYDEDEMMTLSVVDLGMIYPLVEAYNMLGEEALMVTLENPYFYSKYTRSARISENYGGNTRNEGYTNMVDLRDFASNSAELLPEYSQYVIDALDACVVYNVKGSYRSCAGGLSCYFPYDGDEETMYDFAYATASDAYYYLYEYGITGSFSDDASEYISEIEFAATGTTLPTAQIQEVLPPPTVGTLNLEDHPVTIDEDGYAVLTLGPRAIEGLSAVYFQLAYVDEEEDIILLLGRDNDLDVDWENGVIRDNFRGVWGALDEALVYMEIVYEGFDYNLYSIPILLNGEEYNLRVSYAYDTDEFTILGAKRGLYDNGMSDRNLVTLEEGDQITTLHYAMSISGDDDEPTQVPVDIITVNANTAFGEMDMGDGSFLAMFEMVDATGDSVLSEAIWFLVEDGEITVEQV